MKLFSILKKNSIYDDEFLKRLETADLELEENEDLVKKVENVVNLSISGYSESDVLNILKSFAKNIAEDGMYKLIVDIYSAISFKNFLKYLKVEKAIEKDNTVRNYIANRSFIKMYDDWNGSFHIDSETENMYNAAILGLFDLRDAEDENSVIFCKQLWSIEDNSDIESIIEIDRILSNNLENRKRILYKDDGSLRSLRFIEKDFEEFNNHTSTHM